MAGILGSAVGSILVIISCMLLAFPLGTMTAIYLEEFAPKNKLTEFIEININNLAAIPSIIYGLLGLTVYLQFMGVPRSAPLAGGLTLALMALPVIVIATRTSIRAIPQNIRDGALALGASKLQVTLHHVLPLAMPGIMTGTILSIARVMGETAPLIMIGMVAFIVNVPDGFLAPSTAMPVQIYLWSDSAEQGFVEKTSAAIIVLLVMLALINAVAVYLRKKFEVRW
jgi:phosphate transport system permease protein